MSLHLGGPGGFLAHEAAVASDAGTGLGWVSLRRVDRFGAADPFRIALGVGHDRCDLSSSGGDRTGGCDVHFSETLQPFTRSGSAPRPGRARTGTGKFAPPG